MHGSSRISRLTFRSGDDLGGDGFGFGGFGDRRVGRVRRLHAGLRVRSVLDPWG
ncbi:hypothetical protein ACWGIN_12350 [Streptomyces sp. NPDC054861]